MGLATAHVSDMAVTPFLRDIAQLFQPAPGKVYPDVFGRLFVVFRDPVERALNRFEQLKLRTGNDELTLNNYAIDPTYAENNPLVRSLVGIGPNERLNDKHVENAQNIIDQHVLVGLHEEIPESIKRYEEFLGWYVGETVPEVFACHGRVFEEFQLGYQVTGNYGADDAIGFNTLVASHRMDILVYRYAQSTFQSQGEIFAAEEQRLQEVIVANKRAAQKARDEKEGLKIVAQVNANAV